MTEVQRLAVDLFLNTVGPALVRDVASILRPLNVPIMPLKGVLLQRLVYKERSLRHLSDVDILVPAERFSESVMALRDAGFSKMRWEGGGWQVVMKRPEGPPLAIDFHRRLSRTSRSHLTTSGMFERGYPDTSLFGVQVVLPSPDDLFAHLLQHATLHFITHGTLHRPEDFPAVAAALSLEPARCAQHLREQGLTIHALAILPRLAAEPGGTFATALLGKISPGPNARAAALFIASVCRITPAGHPMRRAAGLALAPSLVGALADAARDRLALW